MAALTRDATSAKLTDAPSATGVGDGSASVETVNGGASPARACMGARDVGWDGCVPAATRPSKNPTTPVNPTRAAACRTMPCTPARAAALFHYKGQKRRLIELADAKCTRFLEFAAGVVPDDQPRGFSADGAGHFAPAFLNGLLRVFAAQRV